MMRPVLVDEGRSILTTAEQTSPLFQEHFQALAPGSLLFQLPDLWHLFLVGMLVMVVVFWVGLGCWIVVRLARTAKK